MDNIEKAKNETAEEQEKASCLADRFYGTDDYWELRKLADNDLNKIIQDAQKKHPELSKLCIRVVIINSFSQRYKDIKKGR